jgi:hypothetical protein
MDPASQAILEQSNKLRVRASTSSGFVVAKIYYHYGGISINIANTVMQTLLIVRYKS